MGRGEGVKSQDWGKAESSFRSFDRRIGVTRKTILDPKCSNRSIDRSSQFNLRLGSRNVEMSERIDATAAPPDEPRSPLRLGNWHL